MNEISFTGIHNIKVKKNLDTRWGAYLSPSGLIKQGEKHYKNVLIECDLTDDASGRDFADFVKALRKSGPRYEYSCIQYQNKDKINHVKLRMDKFCVNDELGKVAESTFKINDFEIPLNSRETLPIYTFMAALTRKLSTLQEMTEEQCKYLRYVNNSIQRKAVNFIENLM